MQGNSFIDQYIMTTISMKMLYQQHHLGHLAPKKLDLVEKDAIRIFHGKPTESYPNAIYRICIWTESQLLAIVPLSSNKVSLGPGHPTFSPTPSRGPVCSIIKTESTTRLHAIGVEGKFDFEFRVRVIVQLNVVG